LRQVGKEQRILFPADHRIDFDSLLHAAHLVTGGPAARSRSINPAARNAAGAPSCPADIAAALPAALVGRQPGGLSTREGAKPAATATATPAPMAIPTAATSPSLASATVAETPAMLPPAQVPDAMMRALDKYDALMRSRRGGAQVDRNL